MLRFILQKLALIVPTLIGITIASFAFIRLLPGDPILAMAGEHGVTPERYEILKEQFGFDLPIWQQYFNYVGGILHGNFGVSLATKRPVIDEFMTLFPATVELALFAMLIAVVLGIPAGIFAAIKRGSWFDQVTMGMALTGYSMPIFWWGLLLIIFFSGYLGWTPVSGRIVAQLLLPARHRLHADRQPASPASRTPSSRRCATSSCRPSCSAPFRSPSSRGRPARPCSRCWARTMSAPPAPRGSSRAASSASTPSATR